MSLELCRILALVITGLVIKVMDDYLDYADEEIEGDALSLGGLILYQTSRGVISYSLLLLVLSALCDQKITFAFFLSAYAVGMFHSVTEERLPSGLWPWLESLLILLIGYWSTGSLFWSALAVIIAIQALDDLMDYQKDRLLHKKSWCDYLGITGTELVLVGSAVTALYLNLYLTFLAIIVSRLLALVLDRRVYLRREV